jgi:hypothetical protein
MQNLWMTSAVANAHIADLRRDAEKHRRVVTSHRPTSTPSAPPRTRAAHLRLILVPVLRLRPRAAS